jgi:hypothetical protein
MDNDDSGFDVELHGGATYTRDELYALDGMAAPQINMQEKLNMFNNGNAPLPPRAQHFNPNPILPQPVNQFNRLGLQANLAEQTIREYGRNVPAPLGIPPAPRYIPPPPPPRYIPPPPPVRPIQPAAVPVPAVPVPAVQPAVQRQNIYQSPYIVHAPVVRHYVDSYSPIVYRRLYDYGVNFIPSYYSYEQRRQIEYMLETIIKKQLLAKMGESELETTIRNAIKSSVDGNSPENTEKLVAITSPSKPVRKVSKKKTSRKVSKRKVSKKKTSKKPSRKISKKKVSKKKPVKKTK